MKLIEEYLVKKNGLEKIEKKTVVQFAIQGLVAFSISKTIKSIIVSFPMFKDESSGSRTTPKYNKQRKEFLDIVKGLENVDISKASPVMKFCDEREFIDFIKRNKIVHLAYDYSQFSETNTECEISKQELDGLVFSYRSNIPTEIEIMNDVFRKNEYVHKGLILEPDDIVFDIGANIGAFCCRNFRDVKKIYAFEPEEVNFKILTSNVADNKANNIKTFCKAVVGNDDKQRHFYLGKVPYYYSFMVKNNRKRVTVDCVNINELMKRYQPTKLKVDIEGSEYEVLMNCKNFGRVRQLIFEYNFDMNGDLKNGFKNFAKLSKHLKKHGFDVTQLDKYSRSKSWTEVFLCDRSI